MSKTTGRDFMKKPKSMVVEMGHEELEAILSRASEGALTPEDQQKLKAAMETLFWLTGELEHKRVSIARLKQLLFGATSEKTKDVFGNESSSDESTKATNEDQQNDASVAGPESQEKPEKKKRKGHGRNGADAYEGAERIKVPHPDLNAGDACPGCPKGKVYPWTPHVLVRVRGQAPLQATRYDLEAFRCNLCGEIFPAPAPEGVGEDRYDETSAAMIALLRYGSGLPFNRLQRLEGSLGIPLPASTQWDIVHEAAQKVEPVLEEYKRQSAQGELVANDDTTMKVLELMGAKSKDVLQEIDEGTSSGSKERTGIFTTGILSELGAQKIALFMTGRKHAGENLESVLVHRTPGLKPPVQMCDALSRNLPKGLKTIVANCIAHGRRRFVDVVESFPEACRHVLEELSKVYKNDAVARRKRMSPEVRLAFHQARSGPIMEDLREWFDMQFKEKIVEPNSELGNAIQYMINHWEKLTRFLQVPGAPLDNNAVERALKKAIIHRKNSLFYKTLNGAHVGDIYMSLIYTAELADVSAFDYLTELLKHPAEIRTNPRAWMPWNYKATLTTMASVDPS